MGIIALIIFGAIVGWLSSIVMGSNDNQGLLGDIIVGIVGSVLGGWIMGFFGYDGVSGFNIYSILVGILGAVVLIQILRLVRSRA